MILQSLVNYYESLVKNGKISEPGWSEVNVGYALWINDDGHLEKVVSLKNLDGKKMIPQKMIVPTPVKGRSGRSIKPNFLCDNSTYLLGFDNKGDSERSKECFIASANYHKKLLSGIESDEVKALTNFFDHWNPENVGDIDFKEEIAKGGNLVFYYNGKRIHESNDIKIAWSEKFASNHSGKKETCLVTGEKDNIAVLHPLFKGIKNAQSSGASLVSFNAPTFCSYNKEQGENAQTGEYATFAYGSALNKLIQDMSYKQYIGDTAFLCYASSGENRYQEAFDSFLFGEDEYYSEEELKKIVEQICLGKAVKFDDGNLDPEMDFFIIGIAPNNARLSVRYFQSNSFGNFVKNIQEHQKRLEIDSSSQKKKANIPIWQIVRETYREGGNASPVLAGELTRSIINNTAYPATLINAVDLRIRADHRINDVRAAIIKAYYLKNENIFVPKEVLTMGLNTETENVPYNLGRLFAILERIQKTANPDINATIKDKFFGSASSIPATIFPNLINLAQKHLRKIDGGLKIHYDQLLGVVLSKIDVFPKSLNMPERGAFQLGYYHQVQEFYKKKEN